jgi:DNA-binding CsgD family transcriptional regulator
MWASALLQEARGDLAAALSTLEGAWQLDRALGFRSQYVRLGVDLTRLAVAAGRPELARGVAEGMEEAAALNPAPSWRGSALVCRGLAEADAGVLRAAVQAYRESPRPAERAWALVEAGAAMGRAGHREEGIALLKEGLDGCEELGAVRDAARAGAALRGLGVRRGRRGSRRRPSAGWDSLTPTELEVVRLVAEGLTNAEIGGRLFISGRTVESHLTHVFAKLNVASKLQLAAQAGRQLAPKVTARPAAQRAP